MLEELKIEKDKIAEDRKQDKLEKKQLEEEKQLQLKDAPKKIQIEKKVPEKLKKFMDNKEGKTENDSESSSE